MDLGGEDRREEGWGFEDWGIEERFGGWEKKILDI